MGNLVPWQRLEFVIEPSYPKARFRGLMENDSTLATLFALANIVTVDQMLQASDKSA